MSDKKHKKKDPGKKKDNDKKEKKHKKHADKNSAFLGVCPCCKKHCPLSAPKCSKGKKLAKKLEQNGCSKSV